MTVENALYHDDRVNEVAAVGIPDEKLGELVAAIVVTKPEHHGKVKESELIELARNKYVDLSFIINHSHAFFEDFLILLFRSW